MSIRDSYIIDYKGKATINKLKHMDVNITYISKKFNYCIIYLDKSKGEKYLLQNLKKTKGFIRFYPSVFTHEGLTILSNELISELS